MELTPNLKNSQVTTMAITNRNVVHFNGKKVMSLEEFKRWLKIFDEDKDGMISTEAESYHYIYSLHFVESE